MKQLHKKQGQADRITAASKKLTSSHKRSRQKMSKVEQPICRVGTEFPAGTVVAINNDHVLIDTTEGVKVFFTSRKVLL